MDEMENLEAMDYEALQEKHSDELLELLDQKNMKELKLRMEDMNEFDLAEFLSEIDDKRMAMVFRLLSKERAAEVFANFEPPEQEKIINSITDSELTGIVEELYVDDAVDMMEELPANVVKRVMRAATPQTRALINQYLNYPENSAGSIMTAEFVDLKKYMSVKESFARIRRIGEDKETIYICFVTNAHRKLEGVVTVKDLLLADPDAVIEDLMDRNVVFASTTEDQESVSEKFSDYDLMALPVVDKEGRLVGIVTVDDIIDVMEQEATEDIEKMAGMLPSDTPYSRTGPLEIYKNRIPWLMFLMLSATFTSMILTSFEEMLAIVPGLVAFIPMLMGTGGNSGAQSATAVIRSLSLGDIEPRDALKVIWKEWRVAGRYRTAGRAESHLEGVARGGALRRDALGHQLRKDAAAGPSDPRQSRRHRLGRRNGQHLHRLYCYVCQARGQPSADRRRKNRSRPGRDGKPADFHPDRRSESSDLHLRRQSDSSYLT